jgi:hypothetical protein
MVILRLKMTDESFGSRFYMILVFAFTLIFRTLVDSLLLFSKRRQLLLFPTPTRKRLLLHLRRNPLHNRLEAKKKEKRKRRRLQKILPQRVTSTNWMFKLKMSHRILLSDPEWA